VHLREHGFDVPMDALQALLSERERPAEFGISAFLTDRFLSWFDRQDAGWFAHLSYLRPHPPYAAAGEWSRAYSDDEVDLPIAPSTERHPFHDFALQLDAARAPGDEAGIRRMRSQYYGMIGDVDEQLGRVFDAIEARGEWNDTLVIVTADHGEQLGDHGLKEKLGFFEQSYRVIGIVRDPAHPERHGSTIDRFTENVDVLPTIAEALGQPVPVQCDGFPLGPFLRGAEVDYWRSAASYEYDWRHFLIRMADRDWPWDRRREMQHLAVRRHDDLAYVQFGDGTWLCFDVANDPTWRTTIDDPSVVLPLAQDMLTWRSRHANRELAGMLNERGGIGEWPAGVPWRHAR